LPRASAHIVAEDEVEADVIRHLQSSPGEQIAVAEATIEEVLAAVKGGVATSSSGPSTLIPHRIRPHHMASWISAHAPLFGSVVPRPVVSPANRAVAAGLPGGLIEPILTAAHVGAACVITPIPIGPALRTRPLGVNVISPMTFYDMLEQ
jgi:hypothetical protein